MIAIPTNLFDPVNIVCALLVLTICLLAADLRETARMNKLLRENAALLHRLLGEKPEGRLEMLVSEETNGL